MRKLRTHYFVSFQLPATTAAPRPATGAGGRARRSTRKRSAGRAAPTASTCPGVALSPLAKAATSTGRRRWWSILSRLPDPDVGDSTAPRVSVEALKAAFPNPSGHDLRKSTEDEARRTYIEDSIFCFDSVSRDESEFFTCECCGVYFSRPKGDAPYWGYPSWFQACKSRLTAAVMLS